MSPSEFGNVEFNSKLVEFNSIFSESMSRNHLRLPHYQHTHKQPSPMILAAFGDSMFPVLSPTELGNVEFN